MHLPASGLVFLTFLFVLAAGRGSCPFTGLSNSAKNGIVLTETQTFAKAKAIGANKFCGPPLCDSAASSGSRTLLGKEFVELRSNGFPELYSTTVTAIKESFCDVLNGGCDTDSSGDYSGVGSAYTDDFNRGDIVAGAVQLAFHDAATYDSSNSSYPGGPDGCACDKKGENEGLDYIKGVLEAIYESYESYLSLADFWALCGIHAMDVSKPKSAESMSMVFSYGRTDDDSCDDCLESVADRLPDADKSMDHVYEVFRDRLGFDDSEIVALMGAHSLGRMEMDNSGHEGVWDSTLAQLDKLYFVNILSFDWYRYYVNETGYTYAESSPLYEWRTRPLMLEDAADYSNSSSKLLNTDMCLAWAVGDGDDDAETETCPTACMDGTYWNCSSTGETASSSGDTLTVPESDYCSDCPSGSLTICEQQDSSLRLWVEQYAADTDVFLAALGPAFQKMTEVGQTDLSEPTEVEEPSDLDYDDCTTTTSYPCKICVDTAVTAITPTYSGSTVTSFSADDLPDGLEIDATTGVISGTPTTTATAPTRYTVTATNDAGSDTVKVIYGVYSASSNTCSSLLAQQNTDQWNEADKADNWAE